jgi:hypothetical protein
VRLLLPGKVGSKVVYQAAGAMAMFTQRKWAASARPEHPKTQRLFSEPPLVPKDL